VRGLGGPSPTMEPVRIGTFAAWMERPQIACVSTNFASRLFRTVRHLGTETVRRSQPKLP
jgi:hypothetical protein